MIDPQEQAYRWIKLLEADNSLRLCKSTDSDIMNVIVNAIRLGYPVLIEGLEEDIDPTLRPVLENNIFIQVTCNYYCNLNIVDNL
jgi:dynein heavy chain